MQRADLTHTAIVPHRQPTRRHENKHEPHSWRPTRIARLHRLNDSAGERISRTAEGLRRGVWGAAERVWGAGRGARRAADDACGRGSDATNGRAGSARCAWWRGGVNEKEKDRVCDCIEPEENFWDARAG